MISLVGQVFHHLTVLKEEKVQNRYMNFVRCSCGVEKWVRKHSLKTRKSCGHLTAEVLRQANAKRRLKPDGLSGKKKLIAVYKKSAVRRNLEFSLGWDKFMEITSKNCTYCGIEPLQISQTKVGHPSFYKYNGIDRVDNTKGYTEDNCVPCCRTCNVAKATMTDEKFEKWAKRVAKQYNKHNHYVLEKDKIVAFDVDDTLVMWSYPADKIDETILIGEEGYKVRVWPHKEHIERLKQFKGRGQGVVVWSQGGNQWAKTVVETLGLEKYVDIVMSKPAWVFDDLEISGWLNDSQRSYIDPRTGKSLREQKNVDGDERPESD